MTMHGYACGGIEPLRSWIQALDSRLGSGIEEAFGGGGPRGLSSEGSNRRPVSSCTVRGQSVADLAGQAGSLQLRLRGSCSRMGPSVWSACHRLQSAQITIPTSWVTNIRARTRHQGTQVPSRPETMADWADQARPSPPLGKQCFPRAQPDAFLRQQIDAAPLAVGGVWIQTATDRPPRLTSIHHIASTTTVATLTTTCDHAPSCSEPPREQRDEPFWEQSHLWFHAKFPIQIPRQVSQPTVNKPPAARLRLTAKPLRCRIPLNDDAEEKARRLHSRQALQEAHVNKLKAAATTPLRKQSVNLNDLENETPASPPQRQKTPRPRQRDIPGTSAGAGAGADEDDVVVSGTAVTPMKRLPILANFEEWMKMATDNKINAANSWNFALIDYFHDMSLLKEGDGVNFQKASCTLDGCVKIYTSRVDSVATETGKLLSGLADSRDSKKKRGEGEDGEGEETDEEELDEDGNVRKKTKRKVSSPARLACKQPQSYEWLTLQAGPAVVRGNISALLCFIATQEVRIGVCSRSLV